MRLLNRSANRVAGRLSRMRRGRLAGLVVMLLGLLLTGSLYAAFAPASASSDTRSDEELIAQGRELFLVGCAFCHGQNGEGVVSQTGQYGPPLVGVGAAAVDFQVGTGRMPMQQPGQQAPAKEPVYSADEIEALAAYVASLGPGPAIPTEDEYLVPDDLTQEERDAVLATGNQLFLSNCSACHNFEGSGGAMPQGKEAVPIRNTSAKHMYEAMLTGPQQMPVFPNSTLTPEDKASIIAFVHSTVENPDYGGFELGGLGPVSEGAFAWLIGLGSLIGFAWWIAAHSARSTKQETHS